MPLSPGSPTQFGDIVEYYLYFNDPKLGWTVADDRATRHPYALRMGGQ
ncbi:MAG: hypothetical protein U5L96_04785 [Owenweeksia sp.]|nr:hypothetical protein [Owenweeksia sp.]